jgi:DNA-binding transcriptional regulator YiaG
VDHEELISTEVDVAAAAVGTKGGSRRIADEALADVFGIEMSEDMTPAKAKPPPRRKKTAPKSKKTPATPKAKVQKPSLPARRARPVTGNTVARLRAKFGMSQSEFARLLVVSAPTIGNWEKKPGTLALQPRSLAAWDAAKRLTKRQARSKLDGS